MKLKKKRRQKRSRLTKINTDVKNIRDDEVGSTSYARKRYVRTSRREARQELREWEG